MGENVIREKSIAFAVRIVNLYKYLKSERHEDILSKQLLRAGTSIGANVREGESAQSRADFISKFAIALKECDETGYWLELLVRTGYLTNEQFMSVETDRGEVFALLTSIIKTAKSSLKGNERR